MSFSSKSNIYFHQCDPAGILFYAEVFKISHNAYENFLKEALEAHHIIFHDENLAFPIRATEARYDRPIQMGEANTLVSVLRVGDSSFTLQFDIHQNEKLCATTQVTNVAMDKKTGEKRSLPESLREKLKNFS